MCKKNIIGQYSVYSKVPFLLLNMYLTIIPENYNVGILKDDT